MLLAPRIISEAEIGIVGASAREKGLARLLIDLGSCRRISVCLDSSIIIHLLLGSLEHQHPSEYAVTIGAIQRDVTTTYWGPSLLQPC